MVLLSLKTEEMLRMQYIWRMAERSWVLGYLWNGLEDTRTRIAYVVMIDMTAVLMIRIVMTEDDEMTDSLEGGLIHSHHPDISITILVTD